MGLQKLAFDMQKIDYCLYRLISKISDFLSHLYPNYLLDLGKDVRTANIDPFMILTV